MVYSAYLSSRVLYSMDWSVPTVPIHHSPHTLYSHTLHPTTTTQHHTTLHRLRAQGGPRLLGGQDLQRAQLQIAVEHALLPERRGATGLRHGQQSAAAHPQDRVPRG
jgi:hypothetical protein